MSAITLTKKRKMLFIPLEFETIKINALVDSGAYINVISERYAERIQKESNTSMFGKAPTPLSEYNMPTLNLRRPSQQHDEV